MRYCPCCLRYFHLACFLTDSERLAYVQAGLQAEEAALRHSNHNRGRKPSQSPSSPASALSSTNLTPCDPESLKRESTAARQLPLDTSEKPHPSATLVAQGAAADPTAAAGAQSSLASAAANLLSTQAVSSASLTQADTDVLEVSLPADYVAAEPVSGTATAEGALAPKAPPLQVAMDVDTRDGRPTDALDETMGARAANIQQRIDPHGSLEESVPEQVLTAPVPQAGTPSASGALLSTESEALPASPERAVEATKSTNDYEHQRLVCGLCHVDDLRDKVRCRCMRGCWGLASFSSLCFPSCFPSCQSLT